MRTATTPRVFPDRERFRDLAGAWPMVPVWAELLADVSTPVGAFLSMAGDGPGVLLESVERSERWGRYSFVSGRPAATITVDADGLRVTDAVRPLPIQTDGARGLPTLPALKAVAFTGEHTIRPTSYDEMRAFLEASGGFAVAGWCGGRGCEARAKEDTKATIRLLPLDPTNVDGPCIVCGQPATEEATWARAY